MEPGQEIEVCALSDIEPDDILEWAFDGVRYAIYRTEDDEVYATDALCTHEQVSLAEGLLDGHIIECPRHNGLFDIRSGKAMRAPVCVDLNTYPVRVVDGKIMIRPGAGPQA